MALFPSLSTRSLPTALVAHAQSCCPTMDVAVLSNPTNAPGNCSIQLYRLSGGSNAPVTPSVTSESTHSSSKVWETTREDKAAVIDGPLAAKHAGATNTAAAPLTYIQPRAPETLQWQPDGTGFAFASTGASFMLYSVHDGKPILKHSPLPLDESTQVYLLNWEKTLPSDLTIPRETINAESLECRLPKLSGVKKVHEKPAAKTTTFINPFAAGFNKPYIPTVPFHLGRFPALPAPLVSEYEARNSDDEPDLVPDAEAEEDLRLVESPTLLTLGHDGNLHLLYNGAISVGTINLGTEVDIISASISNIVKSPKTHFKPAAYSVQLSVIASANHQAGAKYPQAISDALPRDISPLAGTVMHITIQVPHLPSTEVSMLARASTATSALLSHAFEAFDEGRKGWEEVRGIGKKWLDRLKGDTHTLLPELQLLTLLLTGRPSNTNMHEYFASKNTERNLENWETNHLKAAARLRDTAFQQLNPIYERLTLWLTQMRGWASWPARFGHLELDLEQIEQCITLVRLLMVRTNAVENMALEEEVGFREFCGWVKFDLERISAIEANAEARPSPKHDVLGVMSYIRQKLPINPLDDILAVEDEKTSPRYTQVLEHWLDLERHAKPSLNTHNGKRDLAAVGRTIIQEYSQFGMDCEGLVALNEDGSTPIHVSDGNITPPVDFEIEEDRLFQDPPMPPPPPQPAQHTRRKSVMTADTKPAPSITAIDLPIAFLLQDLARRLRTLFEHSFTTVSSSAQIIDAKPIITWQPPDIEEDDALALLGLARDPTKITSRTIRADDGSDASVFMACETPPNSLPGQAMDKPAFWLFRIVGDAMSARAFALHHEADNSPYEILDINFFDDKEVALLLRHTPESVTRARHSLVTVTFQELAMLDTHPGDIGVCLSDELSPIPLHRIHRFEPSFEPLQFSLNGRAGRRIATVLGGGGRVLEVLEMDEPEDEEDDEAMDETQGDDIAD